MSLIGHCAAFLAESVAADRPMALYRYAEGGWWELERHGLFDDLMAHAGDSPMPWKILDCRGVLATRGHGEARIIES